MSQAGTTVSTADAYKAFETRLLPELRALGIPILSIQTRIRQVSTGSPSDLVDYFEVETVFPGAVCEFGITRSTVYPDCFSCRTRLSRTNQPTLSLSDYIVFHKLGTADSLRFWLTDVSLSDGLDRIVNLIVSVLDSKLRKVLEGREWVTAPFDWGDYK